MNRTSLFAFLPIACFVVVLITAPTAQGPTPLPSVWLQNSTPGIAQTGNLNVNGTLRGGALSIVGTASGWTAYVQDDYASGGGGGAILGFATASTGNIAGVSGQSNSSAGFGVIGQAIAGSGLNYGGWFRTASPTGVGVYGWASSSTGTNYGVFGQSESPDGYAGYFVGRTYISGKTSISSSPSGRSLEVGAADSILEAAHIYNSGGALRLDSVNGTGLWVLTTNGFAAVDARNGNPSGFGVVAQATSNSGVNYGIYASTASASGYAAYFDGRAQINGTVGLGTAPSTRRLEVEAADVNVEAAHINNPTGGGLRVDAGNGTAVWALTSTGFAGVDGRNGAATGLAVYGHAYNNSAVNYGVVGQTQSPTGFGVYAYGNMGATGVKPFRIDHPFNPLNKYLFHYSSESPVPQNFYSGNVVTDAGGYAWVELPDYFAEINTNFKYQLTVVDGPESSADDFVQVKVRQKISKNRFQIRTSAPNVEVSWRVEADRNDLFVRHHKPPVEADKEAPERGTYQHPELYGEPPERGTTYRKPGLKK